MHKIMIYENSIGQRAILGKNNIIITDSDILDYEWTRSQKFDSVVSMKQGKLVPNKVKLFCKGEAVADALFRIIDYDAASNQMGKLFLCNYDQDEPNATNYYKVGYFVKSAKGKFHYDSYEEIELTFLAETGAWYRETTSAYRTAPMPEGFGNDFPYDFSYDYTQEFRINELVNDDYVPSNFRATLYGKADSPRFYVNNHLYGVNTSLEEDERIVIDSDAKKIQRIKQRIVTDKINVTGERFDLETAKGKITINNLGGLSTKSKNLLNIEISTTTYNGITCTNNKGIITVNGTATARANFAIAQVKTSGSKTYKVIGTTENTSISIVYYGASGYISYRELTSDGIVTTPANCVYFNVEVVVGSGKTVSNQIVKAMVTEDTSLTYADFEPYYEGLQSNPIVEVVSVGADATTEIDKYPIPTDSLAQLVELGYGLGVNENCYNYLEWTNEKVLFHKRVGVVDLGSVTFGYSSANAFFYFQIADGLPNNSYICGSYNNIGYANDSTMKDAPNMSAGYISVNGQLHVKLKNTSYTDVTAFKNAMQGVMLVYELATEQIYDVTDILHSSNIINSYKGTTHVFTDVDKPIINITYEVFNHVEDEAPENIFDLREKDSYIFEKIPTGTNIISTDSAFNYDITLIEKRSEPKWS